MRPIYESLGIQIDWDEEPRTITSSKGGWETIMTIDSIDATINGDPATLSVAPRIINETTFVPLRFVAESIGGKVSWDEKTNRADIISDNSYHVFIAASKNDLEQVRHWLTHQGGAGYIHTNDGLTPLSFAIQHNNKEMIELLLQYGADPDRSLAGFGDSLKPLDLAILRKDPMIVQLLLDYGASPSFKGNEGAPLDVINNDLGKQLSADDRQNLIQIKGMVEKAIQKKTDLLSEDWVLMRIY